MIKSGSTYTSRYSDLAVTIFKIYFEHKDYYKVRACISNKKNGIVYETGGLKLYKSAIERKEWGELSGF